MLGQQAGGHRAAVGLSTMPAISSVFWNHFRVPPLIQGLKINHWTAWRQFRPRCWTGHRKCGSESELRRWTSRTARFLLAPRRNQATSITSRLVKEADIQFPLEEGNVKNKIETLERVRYVVLGCNLGQSDIPTWCASVLRTSATAVLDSPAEDRATNVCAYQRWASTAVSPSPSGEVRLPCTIYRRHQ